LNYSSTTTWITVSALSRRLLVRLLPNRAAAANDRKAGCNRSIAKPGRVTAMGRSSKASFSAHAKCCGTAFGKEGSLPPSEALQHLADLVSWVPHGRPISAAHPTIIFAAEQPVRGDIRCARRIQAGWNSDGQRTKPTFGHHLPVLAFAENGHALKTLTRWAAAKIWGHW